MKRVGHKTIAALLVYCFSIFIIGCGATPYQFSRVIDATAHKIPQFKKMGSGGKTDLSGEDVDGAMKELFRQLMSKLPPEVAARRNWQLGQGDVGIFPQYRDAIERVKGLGIDIAERYYSDGPISPVMADSTAFQAWKPSGIELQFLGVGDEVHAVLIKNPKLDRVFLVPTPTAATILSGGFCVKRPLSDIRYRVCKICGSALIAQEFEDADGIGVAAVVFFSPHEDEEMRRKHAAANQLQHQGGVALSTNCSVHETHASVPCADPGKPPNVVQVQEQEKEKKK